MPRWNLDLPAEEAAREAYIEEADRMTLETREGMSLGFKRLVNGFSALPDYTMNDTHRKQH